MQKHYSSHMHVLEDSLACPNLTSILTDVEETMLNIDCFWGLTPEQLSSHLDVQDQDHQDHDLAQLCHGEAIGPSAMENVLGPKRTGWVGKTEKNYVELYL